MHSPNFRFQTNLHRYGSNFRPTTGGTRVWKKLTASMFDAVNYH